MLLSWRMTDTSDSTEGYRDNCCRSCKSFTQSSGCRDPILLRNFKGEVEVAELGGELVYRALAVFKSWKDCLSAKKYLSKTTGGRASGTSAGYLFLNDPIHQHLLVTGQTFFLE